ncbi:MAG: neutral/alkaline non-lysosomal ceramidase N-terminal domain-containing protein [Thermoleophilaceae bacterium]|nr:neutral/alkaline non-lysosomal ceramidase N-terminal domain-containing protein [Thermoleophilaceae bacterium]
MPRGLRSACAIAGAGAALALTAPGAAAAAPGLEAGVGRADITPPTGYIMLGWARGDARASGQHTRLYAKALVLRRGGRRLVLVSEDLNMVAGGMVQQAARAAGFHEREVIVQATHTHAGPTGFSNFLFKDRAFPTPEAPKARQDEPDPRLYTFMVRRLTLAIRRARADLRPAAAGWGTTRLRNVTRNRSVEAHLADHGVQRAFGKGSAAEDPLGPLHPIDAGVNVLRVDQLRGARRVPVGAWGVFADHGTVNKSTFGVYNGDHSSAAHRVFEAGVRRAGRAPRGQDVVLVYGNGAAGDVSAGLDRSGPAAAELVGRREAAAMLAAWRSAGRRLSRSPALGSRWTRVCFCGQRTPFGRLADTAVFGSSYLTGSEEGRGPLFDSTGEVLEGRRQAPSEPQGSKVPALADPGHTLEPTAVPLTAARVGDRVIVAVPGEMTVELGRRTRAAAQRAMADAGLHKVVIAGYANEYVSYLTTPEEYEAQHYEGGTTVYGPASGAFIAAALGDLAGRLAHGRAAPAAVPFDPTRGLRPAGPGYPPGARSGRIVRQPRAARRLERPSISWRGAADGLDRPLERAFVSVQRETARGWRTVDDDRGLRILWRVADDAPQELGIPVLRTSRRGTYTAVWEPPRDAALGRHRFIVTARRYRLVSRAFELRAARSLRIAKLPAAPGLLALVLRYPRPVPERDLTMRPAWARAGTVTVLTGERRTVRPLREGGTLLVRNGKAAVSVPAGGARDRYGNVNGRPFRSR